MLSHNNTRAAIISACYLMEESCQAVRVTHTPLHARCRQGRLSGMCRNAKKKIKCKFVNKIWICIYIANSTLKLCSAGGSLEVRARPFNPLLANQSSYRDRAVLHISVWEQKSTPQTLLWAALTQEDQHRQCALSDQAAFPLGCTL